MPNPPTDQDRILQLLQAMEGRSYEEQRELLRTGLPGRYPQFVYKYRPVTPGDATAVEHLRDLLVRSRLWLAAPPALHDPFAQACHVVVTRDYHLRYSIVSEGLISQSPAMGAHQRRARRKQLLASAPEQLEEDLKARFGQFGAAFGVCAFGGDPFSLQMWSAHAADHSGICLQFEVVRDFAVFAHAEAVEYGRDFPVLDWTVDLERGVRAVLLRRHESWRHERERRILAYGRAGSHLTYRPQALTGIILGCRLDGARRDAVAALLAERQAAGLPAVALYQTERHPRRYELRVVRVGA